LNKKLFALLLTFVIILTACTPDPVKPDPVTPTTNSIPQYSGEAYVAINGNIPNFTDSDLTTTAFEEYYALDSMGRCTGAFACVGVEIMPTEDRGSIGQVKPTGWHTVKYDVVDGKYLYNRCHLIGFQLTGENANENNLITGTRYLNIEGMLPFENMIADYVKETKNHVLYRVTPVFKDDNLLCDGVIMEAKSVEDNGDGISFCVFAYNVQPQIIIDYKTGESGLDFYNTQSTAPTTNTQNEYVLNTNSKKFHNPSCSSAKDTKPENKKTVTSTRDSLISDGYSPCKICNP
jgi:DNA-entry nuclease